MKKYLFMFMIINIFFITNVYASWTTPLSLEYNISNTQTMATGSMTQFNRYGMTYRSGLICSGSTCTWNVQSIFGNADNNSGKYFTFSMYTIKVVPNVVAQVQLTDGSYFNCELNTTADSNVLNGTCDLSRLNENVRVYKYGFIFTKAESLLDYTSDYEISNLYYYGNFQDYQSDLSNINNAINSVFNNVSNVSNNINNQTSQQAQQHQEIMNHSSSGFSDGMNSMVNGFAVPNNSGLFDIITALQQFTQHLNSNGVCASVVVPIPFTNQSVRIPCMTTEVYRVHFAGILTIYQTIIRGIVYYYIIVNLLKLLKDTIDPFNMKLEVLDL